MSIVELNTSVLAMIMVVIIGRAKRAPHWGVQSRFRVIYIICMYVHVCLQLSMGRKKLRNYVRACSKKFFWNFERRLELPLGILNSTFIRPVKIDL